MLRLILPVAVLRICELTLFLSLAELSILLISSFKLYGGNCLRASLIIESAGKMPNHGPHKQIEDAVDSDLIRAFSGTNSAGTMPIRSLYELVVDAVATATSKATPSDLALNIAHSRDFGFPEVLATAKCFP